MLNEMAVSDDVETLELTRFYPVPVNQVFDAWTKPKLFQAWFTGESGNSCEAQFDLRVGGKFSVAIPKADADPCYIGGEYVEIDPPHRLSFTWCLSDEKPVVEMAWESFVELDFTAKDGGTEFTLTHSRLPNNEVRQAHDTGWALHLDNLGKWVK